MFIYFLPKLMSPYWLTTSNQLDYSYFKERRFSARMLTPIKIDVKIPILAACILNVVDLNWQDKQKIPMQ